MAEPRDAEQIRDLSVLQRRLAAIRYEDWFVYDVEGDGGPLLGKSAFLRKATPVLQFLKSPGNLAKLAAQIQRRELDPDYVAHVVGACFYLSQITPKEASWRSDLVTLLKVVWEIEWEADYLLRLTYSAAGGLANLADEDLADLYVRFLHTDDAVMWRAGCTGLLSIATDNALLRLAEFVEERRQNKEFMRGLRCWFVLQPESVKERFLRLVGDDGAVHPTDCGCRD